MARGGFVALIIAALLIGALAFLYLRTEGADDPGRQIEIAASLRRLKDIDNRWDKEVLRRQREDFNAAPAEHLAADIERIELALATYLEQIGDQSLVRGFVPVQRALAEKTQRLREFQAASAVARDALAAALEAAPCKDADKQVDTLGGRLVSALHTFDAKPTSGFRQRLELEIARLKPRSSARGQCHAAAAAAETFLERRAEEAALARSLTLITAGPRLDSFAEALEQRFLLAAQERELYRVYLFYYTGALLILLAYLGVRLSQSYRTIATMNRALQGANETLEQRVEDRTRELSTALSNLKESEAQLIQSEKMSSLGRMVAGVVHEINTPLAYVKNSLDAAAERLPELAGTLEDTAGLIGMLEQGIENEEALNEQFKRAASRVSRLRQGRVVEELSTLAHDGLHGIRQIAGLVTNLRDFSRLDRSQMSAFDVNEGVESSLSIARHLLKSIEVKREYGDVPTIRCSPSQINQIFLNLITNAAQAVAPEGGRITLRSRSAGTDHVAVEVEDNGTGIPPEVLPKIFDPFFTTKEIGKGTGLGLSIAYKIAEQHGGRIEVASAVGTGTRFTVVLPIASPAPVELAA